MKKKLSSQVLGWEILPHVPYYSNMSLGNHKTNTKYQNKQEIETGMVFVSNFL